MMETYREKAKRKPFRPVIKPGEMRGRDYEVLAYLIRFSKMNGRMPTQKEACAHLPIARSALYRNLERLKLAGFLKMNPIGTIRAVIVNKGK